MSRETGTSAVSHHPPLLQLHQAAVSFGPRRVFESLDLAVHGGEIVALCGANGCGKTTLLAAAAGLQVLDRGHRNVPGEPPVLVPQRLELPGAPDSRHSSPPVEAWLLRHHPALFPLACEIAASRWDRLGEFDDLDGHTVRAHAERWARRFDVEDLLERSMGELSMGQQKRVELAAAFAAGPRLLLLDEPTNGLDLRAIAELESALHEVRSAGCGVLLISHDRELLDRMCDRSLLFVQGAAARGAGHLRTATALLEAQGGYTAVRRLSGTLRDAAVHQSRTIQKKIRALEEDARRRSGWSDAKEASKRGAGAAKPYIAKRAKKMMKRAKDAERRALRQEEDLRRTKPFVEKSLHLPIPQRPPRMRTLVRAESLELAHGTRHPIDLTLHSHDKVGLLGVNGAGKTTLLRTLAGDLAPRGGRLHLAEAATAWLPQDALETFRGSTLEEHFASNSSGLDEPRRLLGGMGIRGSRPTEPLETLSMGERVRAAMVHLVLSQADFYLLDEPTAHLDLESVERVSALLRQVPAGFLVVSHDRRLLAEVCETLYQLDEGGLHEL